MTRIARLGLGLLALGLALVACNTLRSYMGAPTLRRSPAGLSAMLAPAYRVVRPEGDGRFPVLVMFSGCDGPADNLDRLATDALARGWGALIVDSHGPRGLDSAQSWRLVCAGQILNGAERAGDVAVAVDDVRHMDWVDPDRIMLFGASHGGWAVLDFLALAASGAPPHNLTAWPGGGPAAALAGIRGGVLFYPWCGFGSIAASDGWDADIPLLLMLVAGDSIASETDCQAMADRAVDRGLPVETVLLTGLTHGFDQQDKAWLSPLVFDPDAAAAARQQALDFLAASLD